MAERTRAHGPDRIGAYMTSRGKPNENYYAAQKASYREPGMERYSARRGPR